MDPCKVATVNINKSIVEDSGKVAADTHTHTYYMHTKKKYLTHILKTASRRKFCLIGPRHF